MATKSRSIKDTDQPKRLPPTDYYDYQRHRVSTPPENLTPTEVHIWGKYLAGVAVNLRQANEQITHREHCIVDRAWRWANLIRGLRRTVDWQASNVDNALMTDVQKAVADLVKYCPSHLPQAVCDDLVEAEQDVDKVAGNLPLLSESFLYPLLGKDEARTVLAHIHQLGELVNLNVDTMERTEKEDRMTWDEVESALRRG
jgi:hypothetical protein